MLRMAAKQISRWSRRRANTAENRVDELLTILRRLLAFIAAVDDGRHSRSVVGGKHVEFCADFYTPSQR